jgi:hypothetical protein
MSPAEKAKRKSAKSATANSRKGFTEEEKAAMKDRIQELKGDKADGDATVLAKIEGMGEPDRTMGNRLHALIKASAPILSTRLWYGMPAYTKDGKVVCFFQPAEKFGTRYATLGFSDEANLDDGSMWPTVYALKQLTPAEEAKIASLVKKAVS